MWRSVIVLCAIVVLVTAQSSTEVSRCINHGGDLPINTDIEGCLAPPCLLPQLQDVVLHLIFRAPYTMHTMTTLATAYLSLGLITVPINYNLQENSVTCNFLTNTYCPVLKDEVVQYTLRMYIEEFFPVNTAVTIEFRVVDENSVPIMCLRVPLRITDPIVTRTASRNNTLT